jgi:competence protein ComEA
LGTPFLERCPQVGKMSAAQSLALDLPIDINKAGFEDLVLVPGIGEKTAVQIIALREAKGSLRSLEELQELSGMKEKKFDKLKKYFFALP